MQQPILPIPFVDKRYFIRLLEIFPGAITWMFLLGPIILSVTHPVIVAYFIIAFDLLWLIKALRLSYYLIRGNRKMKNTESIDWNAKLLLLEDIPKSIIQIKSELDELRFKYPKILHKIPFSSKLFPKKLRYQFLIKELAELEDLQKRHATLLNPKDLINVVILATYNEGIEIIEPSIEALLKSEYNLKQVWLFIAYEVRGGQEVGENAKRLAQKYREKFGLTMAIGHPDGIEGEIRGKGGNITYAGRKLAELVTERDIDPEHVIVTTLDADNRPSKRYFANLSYKYATNVNRVHCSYQPVAIFFNNIWDVSAPMRVIATGNSFWNLMESMRPHRLRNFAAHAQSLRTLLDTDFWSTKTIVEDGHQYWRTYFAYDGDHHVVPLFSPVYQDAVLAKGYWRTFTVQYKQLRRWAWGVSDFPYVVRNSIKNDRIPWSDKLVQIWRLFEGHLSWATAPLIITFVASMPLYLNHTFAQQVLAHQLPVIAGWIMTIALVGLLATVFVSMLSLPPKPSKYRHSRTVAMVLQWVLSPFTTIIFNAVAAIDAQTRLMFGKYLEFQVTEKATKP
ncbi:MAG: hypothetical protein ACHQUB_03600 [Candidatus Saccharimonadia bacterium]